MKLENPREVTITPITTARTVQPARQPTQPDQPAHIQPAATRSDDSGSRTQVPSLPTRPHAGRFSVFRFKTRDTRPEPSPLQLYPFRRYIMNFGPTSARSRQDLVHILRDLARFRRYPTKSGHYLDGSNPFLDGAG